jgi:hypothetical protein
MSRTDRLSALVIGSSTLDMTGHAAVDSRELSVTGRDTEQGKLARSRNGNRSICRLRPMRRFRAEFGAGSDSGGPIAAENADDGWMTSIDSAAALLHAASRISVLSGAGLSKASGIPTYRDADGLWRDENAVKFSHIDDLKRDPDGFHNFWAARMAVLSEARPNPGHRALVELQMRRPSAALITQNVDGLLAEAGAQEVFELHGNLRRAGDATAAETGKGPGCRNAARAAARKRDPTS